MMYADVIIAGFGDDYVGVHQQAPEVLRSL